MSFCRTTSQAGEWLSLRSPPRRIDARPMSGNDVLLRCPRTRPSGVNRPLAVLRDLADRHESMALLIADQDMTQIAGVDFLAHAHHTHPVARRVLLTERDYETAVLSAARGRPTDQNVNGGRALGGHAWARIFVASLSNIG
jgi:hypothetical protein